MKKMMILVMMMTIAISASAMTYRKARYEALFLTDKMAYELNLTSTQIESVYEINLDYLLSVNTPSDLYGTWWNRRNTDLRLVLTGRQYDKYLSSNYFYRPVSWAGNGWTFNIYSRYTDRGRNYNAQPHAYATYKGGNNHKPNGYYNGHRPANGGTMAPSSNGGNGNGQFGNGRQFDHNNNNNNNSNHNNNHNGNNNHNNNNNNNNNGHSNRTFGSHR